MFKNKIKLSIKNFFVFLSDAVFIGCFAVTIIAAMLYAFYSSMRYVISNHYFSLKMYRLIFSTFQEECNLALIKTVIIVVSLGVGLVFTFWLIRRLRASLFGAILAIKDKNRFVRLSFSTFLSFFFLLYDGWLVNYFLKINFSPKLFESEGLAFLAINAALFPFTVGLWYLLMQARWEVFWGVLIKMRVFFMQSRLMRSFFALARSISILLLLCVLCLNVALMIDGAINAPSSPNIIVIAVESLRAGHLGCYGYQRNTTPHIDALAQDSILFEKAMSVSSFTYPALSAFFTSQFPTVLCTTDFYNKLNNGFLTLAELLKNNYYTTAAFVANPSLNKKIGANQGFGIYKMISGSRYSSPKMTDAAVGFIRKNKKKPFFLFLFYFDPHHPYSVHEEYDYYADYAGALRSEVPISQYEYEKNREKRELLTDDDIKFLLSCYDSEIRYTDEHIGVLLNNLKASGIYDNSIIILLGDHGEEFMDHGGFGHGHVLYQEIVHVPLVIKLARQHKAGIRVLQPVSLIDVMPSLAGYVKITIPSLAQTEGRAWDFEEIETLDEAAIYSDHSDEKHRYCVFSGGLKLLEDREDSNSFEMYDLNKDPFEREDIYETAPDAATRLREMLISWRKYIDIKKASRVDSSAKVIYNKEEKQQLRALGYLQ